MSPRTAARCLLLLPLLAAAASAGEDAPDRAVRGAGIERGLALHLGCGDGAATVALAQALPGLVLHALDADAARVDAARGAVAAAGCAGRVTVERWTLARLPYPDHFLNVILVTGASPVDDAELMRALAPGGVALVRDAERWRRLDKARPAGMDEWTHQRRGPDGNPVSQDTIRVTQVPDSLRWAGDTLRTWSHGLRTAGGRLFLFIGDTVRARDAFNGVLLWERSYAGLATSSRPGVAFNRPVVGAQRIYGLAGDGILAIDATNGEPIGTWTGHGRPLDLALADDALLVRTPEAVVCLDARSGALRWSAQAPMDPKRLQATAKRAAPATQVEQLVVGGGRVYAVSGVAGAAADAKAPAPWAARLVGFDLRSGAEVWRCEEPRLGPDAYATLVTGDTLLGFTPNAYFGARTDGGGVWFLPVQRWNRGRTKVETTAFSEPKAAVTSLLHADGLVWLRDSRAVVYGEKTPDPAEEKTRGWIGVDPRTGEIRRKVGYPIDGEWSPRCYADIAARDSILSQTMEIVGLDGNDLKHIRGMRGQCGIGFILGNNSVYTPPNQCIGCYPMVRGTVAYEVPGAERIAIADGERLERLAPPAPAPVAAPAAGDDWPMYRRDTLRTGCTPAAAPARLAQRWEARVGGRCTQPVVADGRVYTAVVNAQRIACLDAASGALLWQRTLGGRIDTSPTIADGLCLVGCHDGAVYALDAASGAPRWRFDCAPQRRRVVVNEQVESAWPVFGAVLVHDGTVVASAGTYSALDGGLHIWGLDARTGEPRFHTVFAGIKGDQAVILPTHWYKHEDHALNNILLGQGGRFRLYDEWGGWEFDAKDGRLLRALGSVPQPGFPVGRISPGDPVADERWPWCGFDRVSVQYMLQGHGFGPKHVLDLDPRTRYSGNAGDFVFFPDTQGPGIYLRSAKAGTEVDPEPWLVPTDPKTIGFKEVWAKDPARLAGKAALWSARIVPLRVQAQAIAAKQTLLLTGPIAEAEAPIAGAPAGPRRSELKALSMRDGGELASFAYEGVASWDGLSIAGGRIFIATEDGRVLCVGD